MASVYKSISSHYVHGKLSKRGASQVNQQKVLILSSRGVTSRHRHLMNDIHALLPHSRKDAKLDTKTKLYQLNEVADIYNCNNIFFFEARKRKDLYIWMSKAPNGPTVKFCLQNLHTMEELHFTGNCLKGSRPILSFDSSFEKEPHLQIIKELLLHTFGVPKGARKIKPFVDHVLSFTVADGKIWARCYQIDESVVTQEPDRANIEHFSARDEINCLDPLQDTRLSLTEIGPRFVLTPVVVLESSFGGPVIYENKQFISPNQIRANMRSSLANKYHRRKTQVTNLSLRKSELGLRFFSGRRKAEDDLDNTALFT